MMKSRQIEGHLEPVSVLTISDQKVISWQDSFQMFPDQILFTVELECLRVVSEILRVKFCFT